MKLESWHPLSYKERYKVVNLTNHTDLTGTIIVADDEIGYCAMFLNGETKEYWLGPNYIKIVSKH